jgi:hypothetical protein
MNAIVTIFFLLLKPLLTSILLFCFLDDSNGSKTVFIMTFFLLLFCVPQLIKEICVIRKMKYFDCQRIIDSNIYGYDLLTASITAIFFFCFSIATKQTNPTLIIISILGPVLISKILFLILLWCWCKYKKSVE